MKTEIFAYSEHRQEMLKLMRPTEVSEYSRASEHSPKSLFRTRGSPIVTASGSTKDQGVIVIWFVVPDLGFARAAIYPAYMTSQPEYHIACIPTA